MAATAARYSVGQTNIRCGGCACPVLAPVLTQTTWGSLPGGLITSSLSWNRWVSNPMSRVVRPVCCLSALFGNDTHQRYPPVFCTSLLLLQLLLWQSILLCLSCKQAICTTLCQTHCSIRPLLCLTSPRAMLLVAMQWGPCSALRK